MSEKAYITACLVVSGIMAAISIWWMVAQWYECKEMGNTTFYCIKHVM